jgi:septum formation protein
LNADEIHRYVESGEPMDKAGAYGIQGRAALFIDRIDGDYYAVVGLPLARLAGMLRAAGVSTI